MSLTVRRRCFTTLDGGVGIAARGVRSSGRLELSVHAGPLPKKKRRHGHTAESWGGDWKRYKAQRCDSFLFTMC